VVNNRSDNNFWFNIEKISATCCAPQPARQRGRSAGRAAAGQPAAPGSPNGFGQPAAQRWAALGQRTSTANSVIVNPEGGLIAVRATARQHEKIAQFLDVVLGAAKRQVLIEATIIESS
jgi:general secretion pathway protein D